MTPEDFASYADFFSEAALLLTNDGTILAANRHFRSLGLDPPQLVGRPLSDWTADSAQEVRSYLRDCARNRQLVIGALTLRTEHGEALRCRCDGARVPANGTDRESRLFIKFVPRSRSTAQFSGLNQKITELTEEIRRRQQLQNELFIQQQSLGEAERRLKAIFNQQFQFMLISAPDGKVLEANESCFRATGIKRQQVLGHYLWDTPFWSRLPAVQQTWKRHIAAVAGGTGPVTWEAEYALADGSVRHAAIAITGLRNGDGELTSIVVEGHDDTDRKRSEAVLAGQKHVLELMVQGAPLPDVLDALCEIIEQQCSQKGFATVLLLDHDGQHLRTVAGRRVAAEYSQAVDGVAIGPSVGSCGTAAFRRETVIVSDIGSDPLWSDFRELALAHGLRACWSIPFFSSQGNVLGTFAVYYSAPGKPHADELRLAEILSRTAGIAVERRRDEDSLRNADRRKDEFLATLAHELRNPLAPLRNGLHVLQLAGSDAATAAEARSMMERQLQQMVRLVDDLLDVSRISRNKLELRKQRVELREAISKKHDTS
jgi:PAS domain S-box-containing protein